MHPRVAETDASQGGGEQHFGLGFVVFGVFDCPGEVLDRLAECLEGEDVRYGVRTLVSRAVDGVLGSRRSGVVGNRGPGLKTVAEDIKT